MPTRSWSVGGGPAPPISGDSRSGTDALVIERARTLQQFFAQPFHAAAPFTKRPGSTVSRADAVRGCGEVLDGVHDDLPAEAFYFTGSIAEIRGGGVEH